jgi:1-acyl-sn-glycerol-3-phosphate acyltransferase
MIYAILRAIFKLTFKFYFKTFQIKGLENIPKNGPVFFVANHPSAFMDPIVIATITKRPLFFLAKGALFTNTFNQWLLPKFHIMPIFRAHETPELTGKNKEVFANCYKHLGKGGSLLAFPEGISITERKLKKIQTGVARICLGAELENAFSLQLKVIVIGLNFSNPHQFQSDLFVKIDRPIYLSDYYQAYQANSIKAAHDLTDEIKNRLEKLVVAIQDANIDKLVAQIELIYKSQLLDDLGHSPKKMELDFETTKNISDSVHFFSETNPARVEKVKIDIEDYLNDLDKLALNDSIIKSFEKKSKLLDLFVSALFLIVGFPLFLIGFINNFLPFKIPGWLTKKISKRPDFVGSIAITIGTLCFIVFYSIQIYFISFYFNDLIVTLLYAFLLPVSGLFAFRYYKKFTSLRGNWRFVSIFLQKTKLVNAILNKRQLIIDQLEQGRKEYVALRDKARE